MSYRTLHSKRQFRFSSVSLCLTKPYTPNVSSVFHQSLCVLPNPTLLTSVPFFISLFASYRTLHSKRQFRFSSISLCLTKPYSSNVSSVYHQSLCAYRTLHFKRQFRLSSVSLCLTEPYTPNVTFRQGCRKPVP